MKIINIIIILKTVNLMVYLIFLHKKASIININKNTHDTKRPTTNYVVLIILLDYATVGSTTTRP